VSCLLVFQTQLLASATLGCRHAGSGEEGRDLAACPYHHQAEGSAETTADCHKCALYLAVGGPLQGPSAPGVTAVPARAVTESAPERFFYRYTPESPFRPPIPLDR
jgi:hypothetical protein